jgi:hypothetical protein
MNESEKQFSFTRAASSTSGRAKNQIPNSAKGRFIRGQGGYPNPNRGTVGGTDALLHGLGSAFVEGLRWTPWRR